MINDEVLLALLDTNAERAMAKIKESQTVSVEEAMPLLLKSQFNHIAHLDQAISVIQATMATKDDLKALDTRFEARFEKIDERFEKIDEKFDKIDARFEKIDERFERMHDRMTTMLYTLIGTIIAVAGIAVGLVKF